MKKRILFTALAAFVAFSCEDFLDINQNPNATTVSTPELVLTSALATTAGQLFPNQMGAMWAGQWAPSGDVSGFVQEKTYDFNNTYGTGIWNNYYDILLDYKYVQEEGTALGGQDAAASIAKIMSVYIYHKLVDTYNNVPYTDALQGTTVIRPTYDDGQAVYEAIIDDLDEAVATLGAITDPGDNPGAADIVFGGNITKWMQFANTLKLRLLIRQSEMPGRATYITGEIAQITTPAGATSAFLEENANANPGYLKTVGKQNPFWDNYYRSETDALRNNFNFYRSTAFLVSQLPAADPRRLYIVAPSGSSTHSVAAGTRTGVVYGDESPTAYSNVSSGIGFGILKAYNMPMTIFTASESYFLQCEAVVRGWLTGDAAALYQEGIRHSFLLLGVTTPANQTAFTTYFSGLPAFDNQISTIITQKWIAAVGYNGFEAWCDYRRTGFPNVPMSIKAIRSAIPVRLYYPSQELQTNAANVAAQGTIDAITSKVFWDVN